MKFLLDTCTVSDYFRRRGSVANAMHARPPHDLAISVVTAHEMHFGLLRQPAAASSLSGRVRAFLDVVTVLPFEHADALASADLRARLDRKGKQIGVLDALIAGVAVSRGLTLVTSNTREFARVPGLVVEDWR